MKIRRYTCRTVRNMLPLHVGRDLDPRHLSHVDEHLHGCLSCFREFRELAAMRGRLGVLAEESLPAGILDGFTEEVMARVAVGEPGPAAELPRPTTTWYALPRLTAAAAMLLVCLAGWRLFHDGAALTPGEVDHGAPVAGSTAVTDMSRRAPPTPRAAVPSASDLRAPPGSGVFAPAQPQRSQAVIVLESGPTPSDEDKLLLELNGEAALHLQQVLRAGGLQHDDADRSPRQRRP